MNFLKLQSGSVAVNGGTYGSLFPPLIKKKLTNNCDFLSHNCKKSQL